MERIMSREYNILFLGCLYSDNQKDVFFKASKRGYQFAAQNLQESLIEGFLENGVYPYVLSVPSLSSFPIGNKLLYIRPTKIELFSKSLGDSFGFINLPFVKTIRMRTAQRYIDKWYESTNGNHNLIVYALLRQQMLIAVEAKRRHPDIKLSIVIPDLPRYMASNKLFKLLHLNKRNELLIDSLITQFDGFIVLSEPMIEDLGMTEKPYVVIEGIHREQFYNYNSKCVEGSDKIIMYAGALSLRYGIGDLIDAFQLIEKNNYRLWLCGIGDAVPYITKAALDNSRIEYKGMVTKEEVESLMREATLLVNPRHSCEEFTKYSFPSKTLDYLATGTPTLMCHLSSIPSEYDDYLYYFTEETPKYMAESIQSICESDPNLLKERGEFAKIFVREKKNPRTQVKRILELIDKL